MKDGAVHHFIRRFTCHAPYIDLSNRVLGNRLILDDVNQLLGWLFLDKKEPKWLVADAVGPVPALELNVSSRLQRKLFFFPTAWGLHWLNAPLGQYMKGVLKPGDKFFDIGANLGIYSFLAARLVGATGSVVSFEPEADIFESLQRSVNRNEFLQIRCIQVALSDENTESTLFVSWHGGANSLVPEKGRYRDSMKVLARRLDDFADEAHIDVTGVALMKIDVEGHEAATVRGMLGTLRRAGYPRLWIEVRGPNGSVRAPNTFASVHEALSGIGYVPHRFSDGDVTQAAPESVLGREDILFLHPDGPA
jgi:FkbM family methyltransferase